MQTGTSVINTNRTLIFQEEFNLSLLCLKATNIRLPLDSVWNQFSVIYITIACSFNNHFSAVLTP